MDGELTQYINCDIELNVSGPSERTVAKWTADALRRVADALEANEYEPGHHEVKDNTGRPIGTVYFDFTEGADFQDED